MCPISNVRTGSVSSIEEHPVRRYFERGLEGEEVEEGLAAFLHHRQRDAKDHWKHVCNLLFSDIDLL